MASGQDIHICGICRTGFSDIWHFIQHKKDSCSGDSVIPLSGQGCVEAVPVVQTPNLNSSFNCNVQERGFVASNASRLKTEIRNQDASSSYKGKVQSELYNKLSQPDSDNVLSNSTVKDTVVLSSSQVSEAIKYSHPKPSSTSVPQSSPKITHSRPMNSNVPQKDFIFHHNVRNESKKVLNDDIAVFIVSPKSFGSSVTTPKSFQTSRENVVAKLHCSATFENDDLEVINSTNTLNDFQVSECGAREAETYQAPTVHVFLPETSSCFYTESSLLSGSDTSTPCPEDLEVGQISASVLGQSPLAPTSSERTFVSKQTNNPLSSASSERTFVSNQTNNPLNSATSVVSYSRLNTASAPSIVAPAREQSNQKLGPEKRERLKGLSDDLLASCHQAEPATPGNDYFPQSKPSITSSCTSQSKVKSFKAVFTSPSRCGHRLSPTQDLHHLMPPRSSFSQRVLDTSSGHSALPQGSSWKGKTRLYKNISAALKTQQQLADMQKGERLLLKDDTPQQTRRQGAEREILFDNDCSVLKPSPSSQRQDKVGATGQVTTRIMHPTSSMAASVNVKCVEALSAPPSLPVDSVQVSRLPQVPDTSGVVGSKSVQELDTVSLLANKSVQELDPMRCTKSSITTVTAALTQQPPTTTVSSSPVSKQPSQTNSTSVVAGQPDTILVYKNQGTNFLIMPDVIQMVPALQIPEQSHVAQRLSEASPVALTMETSKHGQHHTTLDSDVLPLSLTNQTSKQVIRHMHDVLQDHQPPHSQTQSVYVLKQNGGSSSGSTMTTPSLNCCQLVTTVTSSRESQIQCSNQGDVTNLFSYQQASQISSLTSRTLPTEMGAVTSQAPCSKEISDASQRHNQVSGTSARELCIIRPAKANHRRLKAVTENPAFNTQPQYEVNTSDANQPSGSNKKEKIFTCKFDKCRYSSKMYKDFRRHYRTHTGETPYTCLECGKTFSRSDKLRLHQRAHDGLKPFHCHLCDYKTLESGNLKKHLRIHSDERPYKCQICPYASRNSSHLIVHLRSHTGDAPFVCSECGAQFRIGTDLKRHMRTHTGEKPFKCDLCDYRCAHKGNLKSHMRINHSKEGEVSCEHCDFSSSSHKQLKAHAKLHDPSHCFRCQQCPLAFPSARALRAHLCTHDTVKPYQCSYCPYACKRSGNLKKHVLRHHMDKLIQKTQARSKAKKRTAATDSGAVGSAKRRRKAAGGGERHVEYLQQHKCELCDRGFVRLDSLLSHMNQHKREQGQDQKSKPLEHQTPSVAVPGSPPSSSSQISTNLPTVPQASRRQGMRHIAAAASKLFEENYGNSKQTLISKSPGGEVVESGQESFSCVNNIKPHEVAASATEITQQLPWEHSYTTCLPQTSGEAQSGSSSAAPGQLTQESAHGTHKGNLPPYHRLQESGGKKAKLLHQPAQGDQSQVLTRSHHPQESVTKMEMKGRGQPSGPTYLQREASVSQETSYSFQIVPQVVTPAQLIEQIVLPQSQLQPTSHIQIVVPRAAATTHQASQIVVPRAAVSNQQPASSQVIRLPGSAQQQVLVQDYKGSNQMEVVSLPYSQQSTKIFQMVTSTGLVTFDPSPGQH